MYKTFNDLNFEKYGCKVYKLSIDAGFSCPNRDGTVGYGGCIFCSGGSGAFAEAGEIKEALERAKKRVEQKNKSGKYIAYLQSFTNTYAPIEVLERVYREAIDPDYIVGLSVATRPDCLGEGVVELLCKINKIKPVMVELGLQTTNEQSAEYINRGYKNEVYFDAVKALKESGIEVVTHIIIGLPFEGGEDAVKTTADAVNAGTDGVKFHLLHILRNTPLQKLYESGEIKCLSLEEYGEILKKCIKILPENITVHRITGDGHKGELIAPAWSADKKRVLNYLNEILKA